MGSESGRQKPAAGDQEYVFEFPMFFLPELQVLWLSISVKSRPKINGCLNIFCLPLRIYDKILTPYSQPQASLLFVVNYHLLHHVPLTNSIDHFKALINLSKYGMVAIEVSRILP